MAAISNKENVNVLNHEDADQGISPTESSNSDIKMPVPWDDDPENPLNWPLWRRWSIAMIASSLTMLSVFATMMIMPASPQVIKDFHTNNRLYETLLVSIWDLGEGIGPFIIAPLSQKYGRLPVYHIGNTLGVACLVASGFSVNIHMLIAFRFLGGFVLPTFTLTPTVIGDLFAPQERGTVMAFGMGFRMLGPLLAPVCGGYIAEALGWRWTLWINAIAIGAVGLICMAIMRETYPPKILQRKKALQHQHGDVQPRDNVDVLAILRSMIQPLEVLFLTPVVFFITVYTGFASGILYIIFTTLASIMEHHYNFSEGAAGLSFLGPAVGVIIAMIFYAITSDRYIRYQERKQGVLKPEHRLVHMLLGSILLPIGLLIYGWTLAIHAPWIVPLIGTCILGVGTLLAILPNENYLVDAFPTNSANSVAAGVIVRALFGAVFPLSGPPLYEHLGLGWGNSVLAFCSLAFVPPLVLLAKGGRRIRKSTNPDDESLGSEKA